MLDAQHLCKGGLKMPQEPQKKRTWETSTHIMRYFKVDMTLDHEGCRLLQKRLGALRTVPVDGISPDPSLAFPVHMLGKEMRVFGQPPDK